MTLPRRLALLVALLIGALLLPGAATAATTADAPGTTAAIPPAGFTPPPEWRGICDSVGRRGTRLVRGTNCRFLKLDGVFRRWVVDIPRDPRWSMDRAWPVVMVIHGSSKTGEEMRERTNWPAFLERVGGIGVYPTSWRYIRLSNGLKVTRWASYSLPKEVDLSRRLDGYPASSPYPTRDIEFLRRIMGDLRSQLTLDQRHVHAAGSSQGGRFIGKVAVQMADTFASLACMGWCGAPPRRVTPSRRMSILYAIGERDELMLRAINLTRSPDISRVPMTWPEAWRVLKPYLVDKLRAWRLKTEPAKVVRTADRLSVLWRAVNTEPRWITRFRLMVLAGVEHAPPAPWTNPLGIDFAEIAWTFFRDNPMPRAG